MTRMTTLLLAAACILVPPGCKKKEPDGPVRGSGVGSTAARTTPPFQKLSIGGSIRAEVEVGKPLSVELRGEDNLLPLVPTKVEAGTLKVVPDQVLKPSQPLVVRISTPALDAVELFAASSGFVNGVKAQHFVATVAGGASLQLNGSSHTLEVVTRGAAQADLRHFAAKSARVTASDASRVRLGQLEALEVEQKGPSLVTYEGSPEIKRTVTPPARLLRTGT